MTATDDFNPEDYEGLNPAETTIHKAELRKLRKAAEEKKDLEARVAEMERAVAFSKVGIDTDSPRAKYFVKGYDGDFTPEAIRAAAIEAGVINATPTSPEEIAAHQNAANAAAGGTPTSIAPNFEQRLAEMSNKQFAPADDAGRTRHIQDIARLAKEAEAKFNIYQS